MMLELLGLEREEDVRTAVAGMTRQEIIDSACEAEEQFGLDECEAYAAMMRCGKGQNQ